MILYAVTNKYLSDIPLERIKDFESEFLSFMENNYPQVGKGILETKDLTKEIEADLVKGIEEFKKSFM